MSRKRPGRDRRRSHGEPASSRSGPADAAGNAPRRRSHDQPAESAPDDREPVRSGREPAGSDQAGAGPAPQSEVAGGPLEQLTDGQLMAIAAAAFLAFLITVFTAGSVWLSHLQALVLGAVEGFTEFLPVSSTGHLLVVERLMGLGDPPIKEATDTYTVAIQIGAILAVVGIYWQRVVSMVKGAVGRDRAGRDLLLRLLVAFAPAAVIGLALSDVIKNNLFGVWPVVFAWAVGGVFLLVWKPRPGATRISQVTYRQAAIIGGAQVLALWPGTSRSLATIVAALAIGLTMSAAVEFSFLLGLGTLTAATVFDLGTNGKDLYDKFGFFTPLLGIIVAGLTAFLASKWFIGYLRDRPLRVFGWYRLGVAAVTAVLALANVI